ncbi:MAG: GIY-YIG nuclease family protein [Candidatus Edwardsbacteria bacterium]|nr:GIY-YIG nuclease family protein [Candidatus Edwardsbacteria bacterium]MBU1576683.1 GIY-YIG nuclease family protein [Candidatus Edwardsbacteria bacterium]MBU2594025.1 GIY-YIG nuclease family protein [Candidatus Edwardsbacteria bacterium]
MKLDIIWEKPVYLRHVTNESLIYTLNLDKLPDKPGIYIFARHWGKSYEALYVGKTNNLQGRIHGHLNNLKLMRHLENAKNGKRVIIIGQPNLRPGQKLKNVLITLERAFIRHFLAEGHDLVNQQGVRIRRHEINSEGVIRKSFIPTMMYLEKGKGE